MSPSKGAGCKEADLQKLPVKIQIADMDTVQEEVGNDSDSSSNGDITTLRERTQAMLSVPGSADAPLVHSQPSSRRMSSDFDAKNLNTRRPSAIIAAFRRPSQALALCAATQRKFLSQVLPHSRGSTASQHEHVYTPAEIVGHDALSKALSALYAKLLVLLGLAFPVTEVIAVEVHDGYYKGFYLYLYTVSVLFVVLQYATVLRQKAVTTIIHSYEQVDAERPADKTALKQAKERNTRYGSFYLRLGAIAFGIGSMVYSGLEFGEYFETSGAAGCRSVLAALTPAARMALTLLQMQFIFFTSKDIESCSHKLMQRFGFMHMIATNLCEWLYVLVEETKHEIHHLEHAQSERARDTNTTLAGNSTETSCVRSNMMGTLVQNASPFLFPCTIEYSLICAVIMYEMWKEIKCTPEDFEKKINPVHAKTTPSRQNSVTPEKILQQFASMLGVPAPGADATPHHFSVDCSHAHRGLFAGILLIVLTIISLIMFFVLAGKPDTVESGIYEVNICELVLYALSLAAVLVALAQMRTLTYKRKSGGVLGLDTSLLIMAQSGMFIYCMFSMIGSYHTFRPEVSSGLTGFFAELLGLLQTILQTLFIIDAWWRRCSSREHRSAKPGRQLVTFLLVGNMAMWAVNTLEKNRAEFRPAHLDFYGKWAWTIITHISMPLAIFYRFHSTICLFEVWKNSYKNKPIYINM